MPKIGVFINICNSILTLDKFINTKDYVYYICKLNFRAVDSGLSPH